jgi:hypothetical protein
MKASYLAAMTTVLLSAVASAQASSPEIGTWVLNIAKSSYSPGGPPKSEVRTYEAVGDAVRLTVKLESTSGHTSVARVTYTSDGKHVEVAGNPGYDQVVVKRLSANEFRSSNLRNGKTVAQTLAVVSADGRTLTLTQDIPMGNGIKIHNVEVFDKQ